MSVSPGHCWDGGSSHPHTPTSVTNLWEVVDVMEKVAQASSGIQGALPMRTWLSATGPEQLRCDGENRAEK